MAEVGGASSSGGGGGASSSKSTSSGSGSTGASKASSTSTGNGNGTSTGSTTPTTGSSTTHRGTDQTTVSDEAHANEDGKSDVNLDALTGKTDPAKEDTTTVTVGKWGTGQNDCVINALKGAGYTDQEIANGNLVDKVAQMNNLKDPNVVQVGQELKLPTRDGNAAANDPNVQKAVEEVQQAAANPDASIPNFGSNPNKAEIEKQLEAAAQKYGVPPDIVKAVAWQESTWRANASSFDGGHGKGVMQIDDRFHQFARTNAVWDPAQNIDYGVKYLSDLHDQYGSWNSALRHYNGGASYPGLINGIAARQPWEAYV